MADNQDEVFLQRLSDINMQISDPAEDVRGYKVVDQNGDEIGHVQDLMIDTEHKKVRFLEIASGGFLGIGERIFMIPVEAVTDIEGNTVFVSHTREKVAEAPKYDPELSDNGYWAGLYQYYGYGPYWGPGQVLPGFPFRK